jgi:hypothetical protein
MDQLVQWVLKDHKEFKVMLDQLVLVDLVVQLEIPVHKVHRVQ